MFENEQCQRLGLAFAKLNEVEAVIGATPADLDGIRTFTACLDKTGNDEESCIKRVSRYAWYPRDDDTCKAIALRVEKIIEVGGDPIWRDMFQNERCARLGMAYSAFAIFERKPDTQSPRPVDCRDQKNRTRCNEIYGRHEWNAEGKRSFCEYNAGIPVKFPGTLQTEWWDYWFENERCRRLGRGYFDAVAGV